MTRIGALLSLLALAALAACGPVHAPAAVPGIASTPTPAPTAGEEASAPIVPMSLRWRYSMRHFELFPYGLIESAAPVVDGDRLYVATARGQSVYALDRRTGVALWTFRPGARVEATVALGGGRVYVADVKGRVHALSAADGHELWRIELPGLTTSRPLYDEQGGVARVVVLTDDNRVHALDAVKGGELWTYRRESPPDLTIYGTSQPVKIDGGAAGPLYAVGFSDGFLAALSPSTGSAAWETKLVSAGRFRDVDGFVAQEGPRLFVTAFGDDLFALEASTGRVLWSAPPGGATGVVLYGGRLYHGVETGDVLARDAADGREIWRWHLPAGVPTTPVISGGLVFVASSSKTLYALDAANGSLRWKFEPGYVVSGSWAAPTVAGSSLYFTSNAGTVFAFGPSGVESHYIGTWDSGSRTR